jgi:D-ornithine 4,5-aminomutase subunit alpha
MKRPDDYLTRRAHLAALSDEQLKQRFWQLTQQIVDPLTALGRENTSPSIERSVLLRMGFSSLEAKPIVEGALRHSLLGHGAGNIVYRLSLAQNIDVREAGLKLADGQCWDQAVALFKKEGD